MEKVIVLLSTYNGEKYLMEQLESLYNQVGVEVEILVRDDGSTDTTKAILQREQEQGRLTWYTGENLRPAKSFMNLVENAPENKYYAFCDQDDLWDTDKLMSAVAFLEKSGEKPAIYHSPTKNCNAEGNVFSTTGKYIPYGFLAGETRPVVGCTLVINWGLMSLLKKHRPANMAMHDSWIHRVCLAVDGDVYFDAVSHIRYRQHGGNVVGGQNGLFPSIKRRLLFLAKSPRNQASNMYLEILNAYQDVMPEKNVARCKKVCGYRDSFKNKIALLCDKTFFRGRLWWKLETAVLVISNRY